MRRIKTIVFLMLAVGLIIAGIFNDQFQTVLIKASKVCLECVGIG